MPTTTTSRKRICNAPGELVFIDGKFWCVGEKVVSKNPRSRWNNRTKRARIHRRRLTPKQP